jgi:CubicO group peptidase (beta-lactamase class C family)
MTAGLDTVTLAKGFLYLGRFPAATAMLVIRHGYIAAERYYRGTDDETKLPIGSITKTVVASLVGVALLDGRLESLDQTFASCLGGAPPRDSASTKWANLTIRQLLSMTAGYDPDASPRTDSTLVARVLLRPIIADPGTRFAFDHGSYHLLSVCLSERGDEMVRAYANKKLLQPIGMSLAFDEWETDESLYELGYRGIFLTPRAIARLGYLYLHDGVWNGRQLLPEGWVSRTLKALPTTASDTGDAAFANGWWVRRLAGHRMMYASGPGGVFLFVVPDLDMIVVLGGDPSVAGGLTRYERLLEEFVLGAVRDSARTSR